MQSPLEFATGSSAGADKPNANNAKSYLYQYISAISATSCMFAAGIAGGWNAPTIPKLLADDSPIPISRDEGSWLITMAAYGLLITTWPAIWLSGRIGPKRTLLLSVVPLLAGWLLVEFAADIRVLYAARICFGFAYGIVYTLCPVYLSEIASDRVRGSLLALTTVMAKGGMLFCVAVAPFVTIRTMALIGLVPVLAFGASFVWMPESPYHCLANGRRPEAERNVLRLRGAQRADTKLVDDELLAMDAALRAEQAERQLADGPLQLFRDLLDADRRRALTVVLCTTLILPLCGSSAIMDYSQIIFGRINWQLSAIYASIMLAGVQLLASLIGNAVIDCVGRRPLLIGSSLTMAVCNVAVAVFFGLEERWGWPHLGATLGWLPMLALMVFQFAFGMGLEPIGYSIAGELFPKRLKALASGICLVVNSGMDVTVSKLFQIVSDGLGSDVAFAGFAFCSAAYFVFALCWVPETKGRSLEDILEELKSKKKSQAD